MSLLRRLTTILLMIPALVQAHDGSLPQKKDDAVTHRINYGIKVGCGATSLFMQDIRIGDFTTGNYSRNPTTGFIFTLFGRTNIRKSYIQTGLSYYSSSSSISFQYPHPDTETFNEVSYSFSSKYLQVPLLYGFNVIKQEPYSLSLFTGPKVSFPLNGTYKSSLSEFQDVDIIENIYPVNVKLTLGLCCSMGNVLIDFGYDLDLHSQSDGIIAESTQQADTPTIVMKRSTGVLYFSLGLLF